MQAAHSTQGTIIKSYKNRIDKKTDLRSNYLEESTIMKFTLRFSRGRKKKGKKSNLGFLYPNTSSSPKECLLLEPGRLGNLDDCEVFVETNINFVSRCILPNKAALASSSCSNLDCSLTWPSSSFRQDRIPNKLGQVMCQSFFQKVVCSSVHRMFICMSLITRHVKKIKNKIQPVKDKTKQNRLAGKRVITNNI